MFHAELRQFPHVARAFNLERDELVARILRRWIAGHPVELGERRFSPEKARLTILEGPELAADEMGLGRGWASLGRSSRDVTAELLAQLEQGADPSELEQLKVEIAARSTNEQVSLADIVSQLEARYPGRRVSDRVALAERAVWELLHEGRVKLLADGATVQPERWEPLLLSWETWSASGTRLSGA